MYGVKPGKVLTFTGTAPSSSLGEALSAGSSGGFHVKAKAETADVDMSLDGGKTFFTLAVADGWQEFPAYVKSVTVKSGGTGEYTVLITTVA